jgi:hypothetical protein
MPVRIYSLANRQPVLSVSLRVVELSRNRAAYEGWRNLLWNRGQYVETIRPARWKVVRKTENPNNDKKDSSLHFEYLLSARK